LQARNDEYLVLINFNKVTSCSQDDVDETSNQLVQQDEYQYHNPDVKYPSCKLILSQEVKTANFSLFFTIHHYQALHTIPVP
jgi:hypothetical protein